MSQHHVHVITTVALTASASSTAYGLSDDGLVFVGAGTQDFEQRAWVRIGSLRAPLTLGHPLLLCIRGQVTGTSVVVSTQRLPVPVVVDATGAVELTPCRTT